ncbi:MAG: EAL domain-containing protein [Legionellales bacterium]|nr:EAL domain-containing protein [Legionellales bacterium]
MIDIHILIVDDNPSVHIDFHKILTTDDKKKLDLMQAEAAITGKLIAEKEFNFLLDSAYQGEEALQLIRKGKENNTKYSLAFVDVRMPPGMDVVETISHIWELDPDMQIVICTAYSDYSWKEITEKLHLTDRLLILKKPFENIEVQQVANTLTKKWQMSKALQEQMNHLEELVNERTAKLERALSLITVQATQDEVTKLPNRIVLYDRIQREIIAAKTSGHQVAFLLVDLDNFKFINATLGYNAGDEVLKIIASRLQQETPETETLARIGGDEFVIVIPLLKTMDTLISTCQKLLLKIAEPLKIKNQEITLSANIGISLYPKDGEKVDLLLKNADTANHFAKESGPNLFNFFTMELNINATRRMTLENNLRVALEKNEFFMVYQPIIDTHTKKVISFEALLRWNHPQLGLISPDEFIPVADEIGLMFLIGDWVLKTACEQNKIWRDQGIAIVPIAINLTAKQIAQPGVATRVTSILQKNQLDANLLALEITESTLIDESEKIIRIMQELKNVGLKLVIDDFGTGYSCLSYLNRLPIDKIKIDRSFITNLTPDSNEATVVSAIIAITKSLKIRSLAEGVETKEQLEILTNHHCDEIQGFYFYRPQTAQDAGEILRNQGKQGD